MRTFFPRATMGGALFAALLGGAPAAATTIGGLDFADDAFASVLIDSFGTFQITGAASLAEAVTGSNPTSFAFSVTPGAFVEVGFTDAFVVNGAGNDLALFELGVPDTLSVTINGVTVQSLAAGTGFVADTAVGTFELNVALFDLSDFGVLAGGAISSLRIGLDIPGEGTLPSLAVVGALHSAPVPAVIPLPASLPLLLAGLGGLALIRRRRRG